MEAPLKSELILDSLQELLQERDIDKISVSDIAENIGIAKGSIYYYFPSKEAIVDALIERNYKKAIETARKLESKKDVSCIERMEKIFIACQESSKELLKNRRPTISAENNNPVLLKEQAYIHAKYMKYIIRELKPSLTEIIKQQIEEGTLKFDYPEQLAEILLIVLTVKLDNSLIPSTKEDISKLFEALISLLENGADSSTGVLNYLTKI